MIEPGELDVTVNLGLRKYGFYQGELKTQKDPAKRDALYEGESLRESASSRPAAAAI
jgi:hypothetical protein